MDKGHETSCKILLVLILSSSRAQHHQWAVDPKRSGRVLGCPDESKRKTRIAKRLVYVLHI
jgi:hypothetical protein